jgi:hypothetical protein
MTRTRIVRTVAGVTARTRNMPAGTRSTRHPRVDPGLSQSVAAFVGEEVLIAVPVDVPRADQRLKGTSNNGSF